jgi:hypothetical protein
MLSPAVTLTSTVDANQAWDETSALRLPVLAELGVRLVAQSLPPGTLRAWRHCAPGRECR